MTNSNISLPVRQSTRPPVNASLVEEAAVDTLPGVGPARVRALARLGIHTRRDVWCHLPRVHEDRRIKPRGLWGAPGTAVALEGRVDRFEASSAGRDVLVGRATLSGEGPPVTAVWFRRRSYRYDPLEALARVLQPGTRVAVYGGWHMGRRGVEVHVEDQVAPWDGAPSPHIDRWSPVYDLTDGLNGRWLRDLVWRERMIMDQAADSLPAALRAATGLPARSQALKDFHFPHDPGARELARRRLAFDELYFLQLALATSRRTRSQGPPALSCRVTRQLLTPFRQALGFEFTPEQKRVINEIFSDMEMSSPMNRLLMGEVGSGKTVVAVAALLLAVENGCQAVFMAPTEILAGQHALCLARLLEGLPVRLALLTGGRCAAQKKADRRALQAGDIDIAVGTHALLEDEVEFRRLGLAVIDEQHRFGVLQRAALGRKGEAAHLLLMTATPIPRTLALTLYGDLSVSLIETPPPGRAGIVTHRSDEATALAGARRALDEGRQAYVVFPLVEESDRLAVRAVTAGGERLKAAWPSIRVGVLHGRMASAEKGAVMAAFARGDIQALAATPVIEVGIDVPNATALVIMNAERFGLAQLHQLRGRVGRGRHPSACWLVSSVQTPEADERLNLFCQLSNGFRLAEEDLRRRGPGEMLGEAQHGRPALRAASLVTDADLAAVAREKARALLEADPALAQADHALLAGELHRLFGDRLSLGRVA